MELDSDTEDATVYDEVIALSDDEDNELDETEDGIIESDYTIKQGSSQEADESHEKDIVDIFLEGLETSFTRVVRSQVNIGRLAKCCSIMHGEIRFTI